MKTRTILAGLFILAASVSSSQAAGLILSIHDGKVSIDAQDVSVRQILAEWARVGKTKVVNLEKVTSAPVTLKLENVPEHTALEIILRTIPGYMAAPRASYAADASVYDRILIMATTTPVAAGRSPAATFQGTQLRAAPQPAQPNALMPGFALPDLGGDDPEDRALAAAAAAGLVVPANQVGLPGQPGLPVQPGATPPQVPVFPGWPGGPNSVPVGVVSPFAPTALAPLVAAPSNPWNAPTGPARPGIEPPSPAPTPSPFLPPPLQPRAPQPTDQ